MEVRAKSWGRLAVTALLALALCGFAAASVSASPPPIPAATAAASTAPGATASTPDRILVTRSLGDDRLYFRPHQFVLSGDGSFGIAGVEWKSYGGRAAIATGRGFANDCEPNCAEGTFFHPRAKLRLSRVVDCNGVDVYARLSYQLFGFLPAGVHHRGSFAMRPRDESGGFEC